MLKSTMSDNRILQPSAITIVPSVADIFLTLPKTSIIAPPSICSLFGRVYAISSCQALGKIKIQKNPAIKDWIAGHNIVRIALYCKRKLSFFIFSSYERSECFIAEWNGAASYCEVKRNNASSSGFYEARLRRMKRHVVPWSAPAVLWSETWRLHVFLPKNLGKKNGRGGGDRTRDFLLPKQTR